MKHLVIIGARGAGREVYFSALNSKDINVKYDIKAFIDDKADALDGYAGYPPILSSVEDYVPEQDDVFICALGNPYWRKVYAEKILFKGGKFINIIEKTATIAQNTKLGKGCIIRAYVQLSVDVQIGNFVYIQPFSMIGHDAKIGDFCHINTYGFMGGYSELKNLATIQTHATLLPHKKIFQKGILGAGSVAIKNIKADTTVMGIPAFDINK